MVVVVVNSVASSVRFDINLRYEYSCCIVILLALKVFDWRNLLNTNPYDMIVV